MKHIIHFLLCLICYSVTIAQSGTLDESFGVGGKVINETVGMEYSAIALQQDGKIIAAGNLYDELLSKPSFLIARFNTDGSLDESFADAGQFRYYGAEGAESRFLSSVAVQADGKILVCGIFFKKPESGDVGVLRLTNNGNIDNSFSENGLVITSVGSNDLIGDMVLQPDGKIVITGKKGARESAVKPVFVMRYLPDGSLDEGFGKMGISLVPESLDLYSLTSIALQPDGKILAGGNSFGSSLVVIRFLPDGTIDSTFDEDKDGIASMKFDEPDLYASSLNDIAVQSDGKIIAAGTAGRTNFLMAIARFNSDGSVDSTFGEKKRYSVLNMESGYAQSLDVFIGDNNSIILTGRYNDGAHSNMSAIKYKSNGILDSSFGENGVALANFVSNGLEVSTGQGIIQEDGKIVVGGYIFLTPEDEFSHIALARFNGGKLNSQPEFAKIKKWQGHYGFTWNDWPGNKTTHYSVGRSTNASTFSEIAQIADIPGQKKYQFEDPAPPAGIVYYRLTAVRSDGKTVNSNIISAGTAVAAIKLFPNPAKNSLRIEGLSVTDITKLTILDVSGNIKVAATATGSSHTINIAQLKPGNYMLRMETNGNVVTRMFVKE